MTRHTFDLVMMLYVGGLIPATYMSWAHWVGLKRSNASDETWPLPWVAGALFVGAVLWPLMIAVNVAQHVARDDG